MARFYPIYARRSDGKLEIIGKGKRTETNQPTADQLDQKADRNGVSDFYREVHPDEPKHIDWRRKLGGMLAREMNWKPKDGSIDAGHMLVTFPHGYRLYEHVKKTEKDGNTEIKAKTHAGGGNDRQDAYLYGHPAGRKKRFRSPADFFPHLLWLCMDESGDPDNCGCKICSPEDLENVIPGAKAIKTKDQPDLKVMAAGKTKMKPEQPAPTQRSGSISAPKQPQAQPLPQPRTPDQQIDQHYNSFIYRSGELVWFQRGQAWGLGVVLRRWLTQANERRYSVQPLSQPFKHSQAVVKALGSEMRPWLAWSVPGFTIAAHKQQGANPTFDSVDWQATERDNSPGDVEVDASIMAAKRVDSTYTPIGPIGTRLQSGGGVTETEYNGIFLGGEKCWLGDPLRIVPGTGNDIVVPRSITERKSRNAAVAPTQPTIYIVGDIYTLSKTAHVDPTLPTPAAPNNNPNLPIRLTEDLGVRNARSIPIKREASYWRLLQTNTRIELNDIKGRWYEASIVLPVLQPDLYKQLNEQGMVSELGQWMNARGDCQKLTNPGSATRASRENVRCETRQDAFVQAIPPHARIQDGVETLPDNIDPALAAAGMQSFNLSSGIDIDPRFETADSSNNSSNEIRVTRPGQTMQDNMATHDANAEGNFEDFMNLDAEEDGNAMDGVQAHSRMPGFGGEYDASQGGYY